MILIQLVLILATLLILVRFLSVRDTLRTQAWKKILLLGFAAVAVAMIISPKLLDGIAHFLGVGRGADLLLYALTVAFVFGQLNTYVKSREEQKKIIILARKIAIAEARNNKEARK